MLGAGFSRFGRSFAMNLDQLQTPTLLLDRPVLERNILAMTGRAKRHGVALRPHMKTAKSAKVASLATAGNKGGICVSTVAEAEYFARHGFRDITYAFGIVPQKIDRLAKLCADGVSVRLLIDDAANAKAVAERAKALGVSFDVQIEIDSGQNRGGLKPDDPKLIEVGWALAGSGALRFLGVLTHGGHSYDCRGAADCRRVAEEERVAIVGAAERLSASGAARLDGVTEIRPGNYMFFDLHQTGIGSCTADEIAVSVLTTVVGHNRAHNRIVIDAGGLALSKDTGANEPLPGTGYGWVMDLSGKKRIGDLRVGRVSQEHGQIESDSPLPFDRLPIGARVRVLPNHSCMTAAAYEHYNVLDGGADVVDRWDRINGW
ncbi:MAG: alanine racemase [Alphaproteobacteria bacterium]